MTEEQKLVHEIEDQIKSMGGEMELGVTRAYKGLEYLWNIYGKTETDWAIKLRAAELAANEGA